MEEVSKRESNGSNPKLIKLKSGFSTCDSRYQFELRNDRTGTIFYTEFYPECEEFFHEVNLVELSAKIAKEVREEINFRKEIDGLVEAEIENLRQEITVEKLEDFFWNEINQTLEDPFFRSFEDQDKWGAEFFCEKGNAEEFEEFLQLCVLTERNISEPMII